MSLILSSSLLFQPSQWTCKFVSRYIFWSPLLPISIVSILIQASVPLCQNNLCHFLTGQLHLDFASLWSILHTGAKLNYLIVQILSLSCLTSSNGCPVCSDMLGLLMNVLKVLHMLATASSSVSLICHFCVRFSLYRTWVSSCFLNTRTGSALYTCPCFTLCLGSLVLPHCLAGSTNPLVLNWRSLALRRLLNSQFWVWCFPLVLPFYQVFPFW